MTSTTEIPLVSVIIPCYNTAEYIQETLDSVFNQTYQNIEVIAIDDGSTDNTLQKLNENKEKYSQLKVITQKNTYNVIARKNAVKYAKGKYLIFLDSDDKIAPVYIEKCCEVAEKDKNIVAVYSKADFFDAKNEPWMLPEFKLPDFLYRNCIYISALIRKSEFDKVSGFDESLTQFEDWDLYISLIKNGSKVYRLPETLFYYRQREDLSSVTNTASAKKTSDNMFKMYSKHYDFYIENGVYFQDVLSDAYSYRESKIKRKKEVEKKNKKLITKLRYKLFNPNKYKEVYEN